MVDNVRQDLAEKYPIMPSPKNSGCPNYPYNTSIFSSFDQFCRQECLHKVPFKEPVLFRDLAVKASYFN
jgi:hypothetical protein